MTEPLSELWRIPSWTCPFETINISHFCIKFILYNGRIKIKITKIKKWTYLKLNCRRNLLASVVLEIDPFQTLLLTCNRFWVLNLLLEQLDKNLVPQASQESCCSQCNQLTLRVPTKKIILYGLAFWRILYYTIDKYKSETTLFTW